MLANSSSDDSLHHLNISVLISYFPYGMYHCLNTSPSFTIFISSSLTNILIQLPLSIFILYLGFQRWQQQCSTSAAAMTSHADIFAYHMVLIQLVGVSGSVLCCCWIYRNVVLLFVGMYIATFTWYGETVLYVLTCVESYLAVVHPITYLSLKNERGIRIRNIIIGCVWLLSFMMSSLQAFKYLSLVSDAIFLTSSLITICFCNLSVLKALIRPGPGENSGGRERVDQLKRRAFYTITVILGMLLLKCIYNVCCTMIFFASGSHNCVLFISEVWFNLPCKLMLPLLFLQRAGMFACCRNMKQEQE